jgi:hypothetical protein
MLECFERQQIKKWEVDVRGKLRKVKKRES